MATNTPGTPFKENFLRVVAVVGLIAILLLGAWGIIQIAFYLPTFFSNFGKTKEALTVSAPSQLTSNQPFTLSWKHTGKDGEYSYSVSYACAQGLAFAAPVPTGSYQLVRCNTPFNYINASTSMPLVPVFASGTTQASTTFTVAAAKLADGTISVKGTATTRIQAGSATAASTTPSVSTPKPTPTKKPTSAKPSTTYVPSGRTQNLYGYPDLAVQIISAPQSAPVGSRITLQFVVTNLGTNVAPAGWSFNAVLPYNPVYTYDSGSQQKLYPGDKIVYTLGYDAAYAGSSGYTGYPTTNYGGYGNGSCNAFGPCAVPGYANNNYYSYSQNSYGQGQVQAIIQVDPYNYVSEQNKSNNTATATYQVY